MTVYTEHPDALFDPGKPMLGSTALETRDNLAAAMEGDATAPKIQTPAMSGSVAGSNLLFKSVAETVTGEDALSPYQIIAGSIFRATTSGEVRVIAERVSYSGTFAYQIWKNNVSLALTSGDASLTVDVSFSAGDVIWVEARAGSGGGAGSVKIQAEYRVGDVVTLGGV